MNVVIIDFLSDVEFWTNLSVNVDDSPVCSPDSVPPQYSQVCAHGGGVLHQHRLQEGLQPRARPQEAAGQVPGRGPGLCLGCGDRPQHRVCGDRGKYWTANQITGSVSLTNQITGSLSITGGGEFCDRADQLGPQLHLAPHPHRGDSDQSCQIGVNTLSQVVEWMLGRKLVMQDVMNTEILVRDVVAIYAAWTR